VMSVVRTHPPPPIRCLSSIQARSTFINGHLFASKAIRNR